MTQCHALRNFRKGVGNKKKTIDAYSEQVTAAIRVRCGRGILGVHALLEAPSKEERHSHPLTRSLAPSLSLPLSLPPSLVPSLPRSLPRSVDPHPRSSRHILSLTRTAEPDSPRSRAPLTAAHHLLVINSHTDAAPPATEARQPPWPVCRRRCLRRRIGRFWGALGQPWSNPGQTLAKPWSPWSPRSYRCCSPGTQKILADHAVSFVGMPRVGATFWSLNGRGLFFDRCDRPPP